MNAREKAQKLIEDALKDEGAAPVAVATETEVPTLPTGDIPEAPTPEPDWQQKYTTLKGKYDSEVPRLTRQLAELESQNTGGQYLQEIAALKSELQKANREKMELQDRLDAKDITPERMKEKYNLSDAEAELAPEVMSVTQKMLSKEVAQIKDSYEQALSEVRNNQFNEELTRLAPNWGDLNKDDEFNDWLDGADPMLGKTRRKALNDAYVQRDSARVAAFFNAFKAPAPIGGIRPAAAPSVQPQVKEVAKPKMYTSNEYRQLCVDLTRGKYKGVEAQTLSKELKDALDEKRIEGLS